MSIPTKRKYGIGNSELKRRAAKAHNEAYEESKTRAKEKALHQLRYERFLAMRNEGGGTV